jgi:transcriptional regulator GlxA family with amidase domain
MVSSATAGAIAAKPRAESETGRRFAGCAPALGRLAVPGRPATTGWNSRFPSPEDWSGCDLALKLIEDDCGRDLALMVARRLVVFLKRPGGQSQFSAHLAAQFADEGKIRSLQHWILDHLSLDLTLDVLAHRVAMSVRNFTRVFQVETGTTPADFVENGAG